MEVHGQIHAPASLTPEQNLRHPMNRRLRGPHNRSSRFAEQKNLGSAGNEPHFLGRRTRSLAYTNRATPSARSDI